jgi:hypothetical protein
VTLRAEVSDDRGIAEVRFAEGGRDLGTALAPPYEATLAIPANAVPGSEITVVVEGVDTSLNTVTAEATLAVSALADTEPPSQVTVQVPAQVLAGQAIEATATAVDSGGILKLVFLVDGVAVGEDTDPPYELAYAVSRNAPEGSLLLFAARAVDFANNAGESRPTATRVVAAGEGLIAGEVYDDASGLPLAAATVRIVERLGVALDPAPETTTDDRGRYGFETAEGEAVLEITREGYTASIRRAWVERDGVATPFDARLTPLGEVFAIDALSGGSAPLAAGGSLDVPAGALTQGGALTLTQLSGQGLPAPLPLGWSPVVALHIGPEGEALNAALSLGFAGLADAEAIVAARFDPNRKEWLRLAATANGTVEVSVPGTGAIALVLPDAAPEAPVPPDVGQALGAVTPIPVPSGAALEILPSPKAIFLQPGARSEVTARLDGPVPLPSGTVVEVDFAESYARTDGTTLAPEGKTQDVWLYQGPTGLSGSFPASPSEVFDPALL